jgi:hypothetical protein
VVPHRPLAALVVALAVAGALPARAGASELIAWDALDPRLAVNARGQALLTYRAGGRQRRVLAWGARNAIAPTENRPQVSFRLDYSGGWATYRRNVWRGFRNACGPYRGPALEWLVIACTARDGSHWAVQSWQRQLPNYGVRPTPRQAAWELRLSHWTGELPLLDVRLDWAYGRFDHLYGRLTYRGTPVHGFTVTPTGAPLDTFGRNFYLDTFDSAYGRGWRRENSFLTHRGSGGFCYGFYDHGARPAGQGVRYRATVIGPGVTPDVLWRSEAPGPYDRTRDLAANDEQSAMFAGPLCRPN